MRLSHVLCVALMRVCVCACASVSLSVRRLANLPLKSLPPHARPPPLFFPPPPPPPNRDRSSGSTDPSAPRPPTRKTRTPLCSSPATTCRTRKRSCRWSGQDGARRGAARRRRSGSGRASGGGWKGRRPEEGAFSARA
jgi:hypothetical protein